MNKRNKNEMRVRKLWLRKTRMKTFTKMGNMTIKIRSDTVGNIIQKKNENVKLIKEA